MDKKKKIIIGSVVAVIVAAVIISIFYFSFRPSGDISIALYYPIDGKTQTYKIKKGESIENIKPREYNGYEFIGWFYDSELTFEMSATDNLDKSMTLTAGYYKLLKKDTNAEINSNEKFIKITTTNKVYITNKELKKFALNNVRYLDLSRCDIENNFLGEEVFSLSSIEKIYLPSSLEKIEAKAFLNCLNLKEVELAGVKEIGNYAFSGCKSLEKIKGTESLTKIENNVFEKTKLESLSFGKDLESFSPLTFENSNIKHIDLDENNPYFSMEDGVIYSTNKDRLIYVLKEKVGILTANENVKNINDNAAKDSLVEKVIIKGNIERIGKSAFASCLNLKEVNIDDAKSYVICEGAFENCINIQNMTVGLGLRSLKDYCFSNLKNVKEFIFHSSTSSEITNLSEVGNGVFRGCSSLKIMTLPDSVTTLSEEAFSGCTSLSEITLPLRVSEIKEKTFYGDKNLYKVTSIGTVTKIGNYAFELCEKLHDITSLYSATSVGIGAFKNCSSLEAAIFDNISVIKSSTFMGCQSLNKTSFDSLEKIEDNAFDECYKLEEFTIGENVSSFNEKAFLKSGLKSIKNESGSFFAGSDGVLYNYQKNNLICYPINKNDENFTINAEVLDISSTSFYLNPFIESVSVAPLSSAFKSEGGILYNISETVLLFYPKSAIKTNVTISENVRMIKSFALANNTVITSLTIPSSVEEIELGALSGMKNLRDISIPFVGKNKTEERFIGYIFGAETFYENEENIPSSLRRVIVTNDSVVESSSFYGASSIEKIEFNKEVTRVLTGAFSGNSSLSEINFNGALNNIESKSFVGVTALKTIRIGYNAELEVKKDFLGGTVPRRVTISVHNGGQVVSKDERNRFEEKFFGDLGNLRKLYSWDWKYED